MIWSFLKKISGANVSYTADWYKNYLGQLAHPSKESLLSELPFVVLDTETTGLDPNTDHVLSIGAVKIFRQEIKMPDVFSHRVKRTLTQKEESVKVHGLIQTDIKGREPEEVIGDFFHYLGSGVVVGHHLSFDLAMINKMSRSMGGGPIKNLVLDTSYLAKRFDNPMDIQSADNRKYSLDALCQRFQIVTKDRHTALGDAYLTALLFLKLLSQFEKKGVKNLGQIRR